MDEQKRKDGGRHRGKVKQSVGREEEKAESTEVSLCGGKDTTVVLAVNL